MKDIQNLYDSRRINIRKVGVKSITYPIIVLDKESKIQQTLARMNMYVNLPHRFKGTHMSRFVEILNRFHGQFNLKTFHLILEDMKFSLEAEAAHLEMEFPYFLKNGQSDRAFWMERYDCRLHGSLAKVFDLVVEVDVPVRLPIMQTGLAAYDGYLRHLGKHNRFRSYEALSLDRGSDCPELNRAPPRNRLNRIPWS
jgi:GTP cyclohydrolase IB